MAEYVERGPITEIAIQALESYKEAELQNIFEYSGQILKDSAELEKAVADRINDVRSIPAADVVSRDCYDRILAENDTMREMLAQIGKKPGDKMDDVRVALCSEWIINDVGDNTLYAKCKHCLTTQVLYGGKQPTNFCPNCGCAMENEK